MCAYILLEHLLWILEEVYRLLEQFACLLEDWVVMRLVDADLGSGGGGFIVLLEHCRWILEETGWIFEDREGILEHGAYILEQ